VLERPPIRLPVGVRDFMPRAAARRRALAEALLAEFERWGYDRIITPAFEYADVLARGLGDDARAAAIRFVEPATGEVVALRPDITPQVARVVATRLSDVGGPIRLCYEGAVLRLAPGARGQRELIQAGVELIDAPSPQGDAEVIALAAAALGGAGIRDVVIDLGHVAVARAALAEVDPARRGEVSALLAKKDEGALAELAGALALPRKARELLAALPSLWGDPGDVLARARRLPLDAAARAGLDDLEHVLELADAEGAGARFTVDLGEVRGMTYYTGLRFAGFVEGVGDAVLRGGRYDDLVARYGRAARATGFAIDVEAVAQAEKARGVAPPDAAPGVLVVTPAGREARAYALARALRGRGLRAAVDLGARRGDDDVRRYAAGVGLHRALVCGPRGGKILAVEGGAARAVDAAVIARAESGDARSLVSELGLGAKRGKKVKE
jgi:ATP phosphoribosyltransferase regulatory subunit